MLRLASCLLFAALAAPAAAEPLPAFPFVFADGQATREVAPDEARISFRVEAFDPAADAALATLAERSKQAAALLAKAGVAAKDITAFDVAKRAVRENGPHGEPLKILGYEVSRGFTLVLRDVARYDGLVRALLALPNVVDLSAAFAASTQKAVEADLTAAAVAAARAKAERMAKAAGAKVGAAYALSQVEFGAIPGYFGLGGGDRGGPMAYKLAEAGPGGDLFFVPSAITLQAQVNVLYRLE